jgi:hypothetical protein
MRSNSRRRSDASPGMPRPASSHSMASSTSLVTGDSCSGGTQLPASESRRCRRAVQRIGRTSTLPTASTSSATRDAGWAGPRRRRPEPAVLTMRCCSASKSSRSRSTRPAHRRARSRPQLGRHSGLDVGKLRSEVLAVARPQPDLVATAARSDEEAVPLQLVAGSPGMPCGPGSCSTASASSSWSGPVGSGNKLPMATVSPQACLEEVRRCSAGQKIIIRDAIPSPTKPAEAPRAAARSPHWERPRAAVH